MQDSEGGKGGEKDTGGGVGLLSLYFLMGEKSESSALVTTMIVSGCEFRIRYHLLNGVELNKYLFSE